MLDVLLLDHVLPNITGQEVIYVELDEMTGWLPLHALRRVEGESRGALIQRVRVNYVPSASSLLFHQVSEPPAVRAVGFGHRGSTDWDVQYELADIRSFYEKAPMLFDTMATINKLAREQYQLLALAVEFHIDPSVPQRSSFFASDGKRVNAYLPYQIGSLTRIPIPQSVVISDVSERAGQLRRYVPALFLANGSSSVITTMWRGDRKAKKYFGEIFYTASFTGSPGEEAYHKAMNALASSKEFAGVHRWGLYFRFGK